LIILRFISAIVDEYIVGALEYINDWLGLSDALGACTLLALANGAGDLVTAIVASDSDEGVSYNIGALFGAGLFVYIFFIIK